MIQKTKDAIEEEWTGDFGKYKVTTKVEIIKKTNKNRVKLNISNGTSTVTNSIKGNWFIEQKFFGKDFYPKTAAHEAGHLLGAEDKYYELKNANGERYTPPKEGYENNLMASLNGVVEERIIEEIIQSPKNKVKYAEKE